ncbi:hypothetical protein CXB51_001405 [Gossypium anomalum]|uniref:Reverse transcriptase Ty1/copia-type domain-containing protein n=1 Tax=Gossypium anomalum TaxID=47600 RepID=A0A8J5ZL34_9ROSI|nr:hypothetical protein CXB51_001405 [Gossypium anomalum]
MVNASLTSISGIGFAVCTLNTTLSSTLDVPKFLANLLSVSTITKALNCKLEFFHDHCVFLDLQIGKTISSDTLCDGLYLLDQSSSMSQALFGDNKYVNREIIQWHRRLGHPSFTVLAKMGHTRLASLSGNRRPDLRTYGRKGQKKDAIIQSNLCPDSSLSDLEKEVYMRVPPRFEDKDTQGKGKITLLIVYVDDIIMTGNDKEEMARLKKQLAQEFEIKLLGKLQYFLGIEAARSKKGTFISQRKYVLDLLTEAILLGCKPAKSPIESNHKLQAGIDEMMDKERYQKLVKQLIYHTHTRLDIAYAVSLVR